MSRNRARPLAPLLTVLLALLPACASTRAQNRSDDPTASAESGERQAYRPILPSFRPLARARPLYLSGYPGADYRADRPPRRFRSEP
ncbi:MAG: hypothetical protein NVSMB9_21520 [Isosphaeraceae bacterium]